MGPLAGAALAGRPSARVAAGTFPPRAARGTLQSPRGGTGGSRYFSYLRGPYLLFALKTESENGASLPERFDG